MNVESVGFVVILLLVFVVGFGALANRLKTPYPIVLVIAGLLLSLIPAIPQVTLNPELVFVAFLPPLLFGAAFQTSWRDFKHMFVSIFLLAFGLVGFTVLGIAAISRWMLPGFDWRMGLVLGAVVATTDAIAATAIAKQLGLPRRIVDTLEGESLVNDASGLLALEFTVALLVTGKTPTLAAASGRLVFLIAGGIVIGLLVGKLVHWLETFIDDPPIEITISILVPYVAYLAAEYVHASGVLAAVACGLYLGRASASYLSSSSRIEGYAVWNTLTFALNGLVFVLIGLQLPHILASIRGVSHARLLLDGAAFSLLVIGLRLAWMYPGARLSYYIRTRFLGQREEPPSLGGIFVVGWTGMRGVVALAAAISLPETLQDGSPFPQRSLILFLTFCIIFVTLVLQGLTLPWVIRKVGLAGVGADNCEEQEARRLMLQAALDRLEQGRERDGAEFQEIYDDVATHYRQRMAHLKGDEAEGLASPQHFKKFRELSQELRRVELSTAIQLRDQNRINDEVLRTLQREIDLLDARYSSV